jgi:hypothetical protein
MIGVLCGIIAAALTFLAAGNLPAATLVGLAALGSAISFFHKFIE